jgi:hypothetical protein
MSPRSRKKSKEQGSPTSSVAKADFILIDHSKQIFAYLEIILQQCEKSLWTRVLNVFMDTGYNIKEICKICNISHKILRETIITGETDFVKFSKIISYVPKGDQIDYLWIFLDCWNLSTALDRISSMMVFNGETAPRKDQWPYKIPSEEEDKRFIKLLKEVGNDPQVYALFRMHDYDINIVRQILGGPPDNTDNDIIVDEKFEQLCQALNPGEREGAFEIYCSNGRDIELTCQLLDIQRSASKGHRNQSMHLNVNREFIRPKLQLIWPDHEKQEPAEILFQIQAHSLVIDIHYYTCNAATEAITKFLSFHQRENTRSELRIITGKGNNSQSKAILKDHVKMLLKNMNITHFTDPKNSGQILLCLKSQKP